MKPAGAAEVMGFAVQLYFDPKLEAEILGLRRELTDAGVTPTLERIGDRPHVGISVLNALSVERAIPALERFASSQSSFPVAFGAFGSFPAGQGVVFLAPTPTEHLLRVQRQMHELLVTLRASVHEHYFPDGWLPHCTIGFEISPQEVALAMSWLQANLPPLQGRFSSIGMIEFRPVKALCEVQLAARQ